MGTISRSSFIVVVLLCFLLTLTSAQTGCENNIGYSWICQEEAKENEYLYGLDIIDENNGWAVGSPNIYFFDGTSWTIQNDSIGHFNDVYASDPNHIWAAGAGARGLVQEESLGAVFFFDGNSWELEIEASGTFLCIDGKGDDDVWAVGDKGNIFHFDGSSWSKQDIGSSGILHAVSVVDKNHVWVSSEEGQILFFDGNSWIEQYFVEEGAVLSLSAVDEKDVWAISQRGNIYHYDGSNWNLQYASDAILGDIFALDQTHVWACGKKRKGHGVIQFYDGTSWNTQYEVKGDGWISGIEALDPRHIWAVGFGGIYFGEQK